jgi:peptidoglycan/xylan/chitin deacetylase (PgdA/CDA1 family)
MIVSLTAAAIGLVGSTAYFSPWIWRQSRMAAIRKDVTKKRILALTYDDGPSETLTPQLLDLLRQHNATATFFMVGRNAKKYPNLVNRVLQEGHDVGCHTAQHLNAWKASPWRAVADIDDGYEMLSPWIGSNAVFRPPHGKMTLPTYWSIRNRGASVWWWTVDSGDTYKRLPQSSQVVDAVHRQHGGIILMHDVERSNEQKDFVLETTAALLDLARRESLHVTPLRDLCH